MTRYLVDTNVISATAPTAAVTRAELAQWMDVHSSALFLSAVTVAEIADGIAKASASADAQGLYIVRVAPHRSASLQRPHSAV